MLIALAGSGWGNTKKEYMNRVLILPLHRIMASEPPAMCLTMAVHP